jgi:structure-specific endonuclease subunit SLX1
VKRNGLPKKPRQNLLSILSNLHLLLRVPSFARWPLSLHFFAKDVHDAWEKWCLTANEPVRKALPILTDFSAAQNQQPSVGEAGTTQSQSSGIHALPLDYSPMKSYAEKARSIFSFEREGHCVVCKEELLEGKGLYAVCSNDGCESVGHLQCWSRHLLKESKEEGAILPMGGPCPKCDGHVHWGQMMRELSLRERGRKEVDKLLRKKRAPRRPKPAA